MSAEQQNHAVDKNAAQRAEDIAQAASMSMIATKGDTRYSDLEIVKKLVITNNAVEGAQRIFKVFTNNGETVHFFIQKDPKDDYYTIPLNQARLAHGRSGIDFSGHQGFIELPPFEGKFTFGKSAQRKIYGYAPLATLLNLMLSSDKPFTVCMPDATNRRRVDPNLVIAIFSNLPQFDVVMRAYAEDPDNGVKCDPEEKLGVTCPEVADQGVYSAHFTKANVEAYKPTSQLMVYQTLVLVCLTKNFVDDPQRYQLNKIITARVRAIVNLLSLSDIDIDALPNGLDFMDKDALSLVANGMSTYPNLRRAIQYLVLRNSTQELCIHWRMLIQDTNLTMYKLIVKWLSEAPKSKAHVHPKIVPEIVKFVNGHLRLINLYGDNWIFFRVFEPKNISTAVTQWPHLQVVSLLYAMTECGDVTLGNLTHRGNAQTLNYADLLAHELPEKFTRVADMGVPKLSLEAQLFMNLNMEEITADAIRDMNLNLNKDTKLLVEDFVASMKEGNRKIKLKHAITGLTEGKYEVVRPEPL
jgi:hypothetical protein